ncbi:hypothetical protein P171DRAFT_446043 [Karstenula rhodostoma CBS 690.94]|uniref:Uncharacterized protein n=1 Tax=Karstenula rhodostoma CBS 690.94 TaxID=1392251 RepID=A0A9P4PG31_9PLEO|nr:hypothetical protein P171DRAFT_446043 [Karstenula rhodostoma CBS 690.94]
MPALDLKNHMHRCIRLPPIPKVKLGLETTVHFSPGVTLRSYSLFTVGSQAVANQTAMPLIQALKPDPTPTSQNQEPEPLDSTLLLKAASTPNTHKDKALAKFVVDINSPDISHDHYAKAIEDYITGAVYRRDDSTKVIDDYVMSEHQRLQRIANQQDKTSLEQSIKSIQNLIILADNSLRKDKYCLDDLATLTKAIQEYYMNKDPRLDDAIDTKLLEKCFEGTKHILRRVANHDAREDWTPSLPWHLPSHISLYATGPCLICWHEWDCLGGSEVQPYESTHGMNTNPDPEVDPGVIPDRSAYGKGPERLCVVCWNTPGGCELCKWCSPPSHWTFEEQRRQEGQRRQEEQRRREEERKKIKRKEKKRQRKQNKQRRQEEQRQEEQRQEEQRQEEQRQEEQRQEEQRQEEQRQEEQWQEEQWQEEQWQEEQWQEEQWQEEEQRQEQRRQEEQKKHAKTAPTWAEIFDWQRTDEGLPDEFLGTGYGAP